MAMIYTCNYCRFTFRRSGNIEECPDCGRLSVREATEKEKEEYLENHGKEENGNVGKNEK